MSTQLQQHDIELNNVMYIDSDIYIGNINTDTYLYCNIADQIIGVKFIEGKYVNMCLHMYFENNVKLILTRKLSDYTYELDMGTYGFIKKGSIDGKYVAYYPYNINMTRPLYDLEYYSKMPLYNSDTYLKFN